MTIERISVRKTAAAIALAAALAACSGAAPIASTAPSPTDPPANTPAPTATPEPSAAVVPSAEPETPAPSRKPRPSLDIDLAEIAAYMTSSITLLNLGDEDLSVVVSYLDAESDVAFPLGEYALGSMDQVTNDAPPGTYVLDFRRPDAAVAAATSCTIEMADGDGYVIAALDDAIAITSTANPPTTAGELFVATSPLCLG